jgi:hypothetical protein
VELRSTEWHLENRGTRRWFSGEPLKTVVAWAVAMTGLGEMSGADEVTLLDKNKHAVVSFVANPKHKGCHLVIPIGSPTMPDDLQQLKDYMVYHGIIRGDLEPAK